MHGQCDDIPIATPVVSFPSQLHSMTIMYQIILLGDRGTSCEQAERGVMKSRNSLSLSLSGLTAIFPDGPGSAGTRMSPFWIYWS